MGSTRAKIRVFIDGTLAAEESHILDARNCHWKPGMVTCNAGACAFAVAISNNYICDTNNPEE